MMRRVAVAAAALAAGADAFSVGPVLPSSAARSGVSRKTSPLQMLSEDAAVTRRGALMTAAGIALSLRNPSAASAANTVTATMSLNTFEGVKGDVVFELYPDLAPKTVAAFKKYADDGLYDKTAFFRVAKFAGKGVLMGGDPWTKEEQYCYVDESSCATKFCYEKKADGGYSDQIAKTCTAGNWYGPDGFVTSSQRASRDDNGKAIRDKFGKGGPPGWRKDGLSKVKLEPEFGKLPIERGVISMRRFGNPDSAGSQFIISLSDMKDEMEGNHAAFGKVTQGLDLLDKVLEADTFKSEPLRFPRDDKKMATVWPAYNLPTTRQGIDKIVVQ